MPGIKGTKLFILRLTIFFLLLVIAFSVSCKNQDKISEKLSIINSIPNSLKEISGITAIPNDNHLYAVNDSGNDNILFRLNQNGDIIQEFVIPNSTNVDWEDLTYDHQGNIYIGDFGNNDNKRKDLTIYKVSGITTGTIKTSKIKFYLEDQDKYPPSKKDKNFDIEAFVYKNDNFYLFTRNRTNEFNGEIKIYKVLDTPEKQKATLISTYKTCNDSKDCFVTGAAIDSKGKKIALLTYNKIFILSNFTGDKLFDGTVEKIKLNDFSQKEGICFKNDSTLLIVDEKRKKKEGLLYKYRLD